MPQLDLSFYFSQFLWMVICLAVLVFSFKKVFIPRMNDILLRREEHIDRLKKQTEALEENISSVEEEIAEINAYKEKKVHEIILKAVKKADEVEASQLQAIKDENEALLNGTRARLIEEMKNIGVISGDSIDSMADEIFAKLFTETQTGEGQK